MFNKKAAIGLAINTIVIVIISIVILGAGITLMRNMIGGADDIKAQLDQQTEAELERLLIDQGKKVALPLHTTTIEAGESHVFGLGILNIDESVYGNAFEIEVSYSSSFNEDGDDPPATYDPLSWVLYDTEKLTVTENEHHSEAILVNPLEDTPKGTYIFDVKVFQWNGVPADHGPQYDNTKKFYVTVT
jgi:hypothetical protein